MWENQAVKVGYKWCVGNGEKIKFWEYVWFGTLPLATTRIFTLLLTSRLELLRNFGMGHN
jgi:hypothetical protein